MEEEALQVSNKLILLVKAKVKLVTLTEAMDVDREVLVTTVVVK